MNTAVTPLPADHPMMIAWNRYRASEGFANSMRWLAHEEHREGSMWSAFMAGWYAGQAKDSVVLDGTKLSRRQLAQLQEQARLGTQMRVVPPGLPPIGWRALAVAVVLIVLAVAVTLWCSR